MDLESRRLFLCLHSTFQLFSMLTTIEVEVMALEPESEKIALSPNADLDEIREPLGFDSY